MCKSDILEVKNTGINIFYTEISVGLDAFHLQ